MIHPSVHALRRMLTQKKAKGRTLIYCDLHGHSKKLNSFVYGCNTAANGGFSSWTKVRLLPRLIASLTPRFHYNECTFRIEASKLGTGRIVLWNEFSVTNSFTMETSMFGFEDADGQVKPFWERDMRELGEVLVKGLYTYTKMLKELERELKVTNGWLKPSKMKELTGNLASEQLKQSQLKKKLDQKSAKIDDIQQRKREHVQQVRIKNE